jgi:invasion protein IalB
LIRIAKPAAGGRIAWPIAVAALLAALVVVPWAGAGAQETPGAGQAPPTQPAPGAQGTTPTEQPPPTQPTPGPGAQGTAPSERVTRTEQHQDWLVRCGRPGQSEVCEMVQQPVGEKGEPVMAVAVGKVPGNPNPGMIILLPLGIALPPGVELRIDGGAAIETPVERCERQGCQVEMLLEPDLLTALKAGSRVTVDFHVHRQDGLQRVRVPFSLLGFTTALDEVQSPG